ncbi:prohibitin family protein [Candidatus Bipolaricaulota bacterium]
MLGIKLLIVIGITGATFLALRPIRFDREAERTTVKGLPLVLNLLVLLIAFVIVQGFGTVPTGHQGIVLRWSAATGAMKAPGLYWVIPIRDSVDPISVQIQERTKTVEAASNDLQDVDATITVNYHVMPSGAAKLYQEVIRDYRTAIIDPAIEDIVKGSTANYTPEEMLQNRSALRDSILSDLQARLQEYEINVTNVAVTNLKFSAQYTQSIEDKVIAEQRALESENKLRQVEFEAQQEIEKAKAEAEKIRIQAEAIQAQGGMEYVMLQMIQAWNGSFPNTLIMSGDAGPFEILNLGDFASP